MHRNQTPLFEPAVQTVAGLNTGNSLHPHDVHRLFSVSSTSSSNSLAQTRERSPGPTDRLRKNSNTGSISRTCRSCRTVGEDRSWCNLCAVSLCSDCWDRQIAHSEDTRAADNVPHEKTDYELAEKVKACLEPNMTDEQQKRLHIMDEDTTWFGVAKDEMQELIFEDCGRYARIMADCSSDGRACQYPSLVSFVGQTGQ